MPDSSAPICLAVLNPGGRDPEVDYADGPGEPSDGGHPPVNYHAFAAATRGGFFDRANAVREQARRFDAVVVLIRKRVGLSLEAVRQLKETGSPVLVAWKEAGPFQIADQLKSAAALEAYRELLEIADGMISPTTVLPPRWGKLASPEGAGLTRFVPTPYPIEFPAWDFGRPTGERDRGILVGTRQFFAPTRNHLPALSRLASLSKELDIPVTVINGDKKKGRRLLEALAPTFSADRLTIVDRPLHYPAYLELMARHRLVFQLDRSAVPGQVAGDAALCRTLCVGGNSALEGVIYPDLSDDGGDDATAVDERVRRLVLEDDLYEAAVQEAGDRAAGLASYAVVASRLASFVAQL